MVTKQQVLSYTAIFDPDGEGGFTVTVPALPGLVTEGDTFEEARAMAIEAIQFHLEGLRELGEELPIEDEAEPIRVEKLGVQVVA
ncbi:type II toxin-antitoxin system HicB family antitoxin [bacterium]|nr:type II toxin-antitoxin system HicB family antitoxin [bacterium]MCB9476571.1 type II toxin-antitoxin system HicB family antitoxin [Deltaproteobacteria bacterium]